jgi:peroxiredoxin
MRVYILIVLAAMPLLGSGQIHGFKINGKVQPEKFTPYSVVLSYPDKNGQRVTDTSLVTDGQFQFEGLLPEPSRVWLKVYPDTINHPPRKRVSPFVLNFCLDNSHVTLQAFSFEDFWICGSPVRNDQVRYQVFMRSVPDTLKWKELIRAERAATEAFITKNPQSPMSLILLKELMMGRQQLGNSDSLFQLLAPALRDLPSGRLIAERIESFHRVAVSQMAPEIVLPDSTGKLIKLSDMKGKYVLIEFWTSGCKPCREENPHLVKAYTALKDKNFEILGVSLDQQPNGRSAWLKAIKKDGLKWLHVSDLKGHASPVAKVYGVHGVPANFLVDPSGKIIANNLRGENVLELLQKYVK